MDNSKRDVQYPIFYRDKYTFTAVFGKTNAFQIVPNKHGKSDGYSFNVYKSRAKVIKLESFRHSYNNLTPDQFYTQVFSYMKAYLNVIHESTVMALPNFTMKQLT